MKKIDVRKIVFKYVDKIKSLIKYNFEEVVTKVVPKNYYAVVKEEHECDIKEGVFLVCISLLLTKLLVILMDFCVFFRFNKVLGDFGYVFRITFETVVMKNFANIIVSSLALIVIPVLFFVYTSRYHGGRQKTQIYFGMMIFSLLMILKKAYDIIVAFGTITDSLIVMSLVIILYLIAAVGYISILKGCLDFCIYAFDENKKDLVKTDDEESNLSATNSALLKEENNIQNGNSQNIEVSNPNVSETSVVNEQNQL